MAAMSISTLASFLGDEPKLINRSENQIVNTKFHVRATILARA